MSRNRRNDQGSSRERSAEQRERDRLEREARRAAGQTTGEGPAPAPDSQPPPTSRQREQQPPTPPRRAGRLSRGSLPDDRPPEPPGSDRAAARRAARRSPPPGERDEPSVLRIQPDPPAPPAAAAGALGDETERPIGIRRVQRAVVHRSPRAIVTPPGDVPTGPARARRSLGARIGALVAFVLFALLILMVVFVFQPFGSAEGAQVSIVVPAGAGAGDIGKRLADAGVVGSAKLFSLRAALSGKRGELRSGRHVLRRGMTYGAAVDALTKPAPVKKVATVDVTIPEGRSRRETARLPAVRQLRGDYVRASQRFSGRLNPFRYGAPKGTRSLEGFLFPATYELQAGAPARDLVAKQLVAFRDNFDGVDLDRAKRRNLTAYDILIIASMVEREAQLAGERPKIAAVIYNRLKDGVPLGIDATIRYATNNWTRPLRQSELQIDSPYNSRKRQGLPPTPIGNPGLASIRAAAKPANVGFLYYVVQPGTCGKHAFSSTFAKFQADSRRYDTARSAAGGKSPTTC